MDISKRTWKIIQRIATFLLTVFIIVFVIRFAVYFMPFLVAGIIAIMIEPIIKFFMNRLKMSRRASSIIIVSITVILICLATYYGGMIAIKEIIRLTKNITPAISSVVETSEQLLDKFKSENSNISPEVLSSIDDSVRNFISNASSWVIDWVTGLTKYILSAPRAIINVVITILALIFFTKDRIYVIDLAEHHLPKAWIKKIKQVSSEFFHTLGRVLKSIFKDNTYYFCRIVFSF